MIITKDAVLYSATLNDDCVRTIVKSIFVRKMTEDEMLENQHFDCVVITGGVEQYAHTKQFYKSKDEYKQLL